MGETLKLDDVVQRLKKRKGEYKQISDATGLDYSWLTKLANGKIDDPGINKIQKLNDHLNAIEQAA